MSAVDLAPVEEMPYFCGKLGYLSGAAPWYERRSELRSLVCWEPDGVVLRSVTFATHHLALDCICLLADSFISFVSIQDKSTASSCTRTISLQHQSGRCGRERYEQPCRSSVLASLAT